MAIDRVRPMKWETPAEGGTQTDEVPTVLDPREDYVDARGISCQHPGPPFTDDEDVRVERDAAGNLVLTDPVAGTYTLASLVGGGFDINVVVWDNAGGIVYDDAAQAVTKG